MLDHILAELERERENATEEREQTRKRESANHEMEQTRKRESAKESDAVRSVALVNVAPIERLAIPLPPSGVVVLHGRNGLGKSHALAAVDSLVSGRGKVPCRDGAAKGLVEGFGARLTIGRSSRRTGEAEVASLEGRLDISQLVQPPIKEEEAADRTRIKALIQLAGASADIAHFARILPEGTALGQLIPPSEQSDDPVILAGRIKRALEAEARRAERAAEEARGKAAALQGEAAACGCDRQALDLRRDKAEAALQAALVAAKEIETRAAEARKAAARAEKAAEAMAALRQSQAAGDDPEALAREESELTDHVAKLEKALAVAQERRSQVRRRLSEARTVRSQIEQLERIVSAVPEPIDEAQIAAASEAVAQARADYDRAVQAERAWALARRADEQRQAAAAAEREALVLRDAAQATDGVLSELVGQVTSRLRVADGRLVVDTDRGAEPFGELSPGERWRIAIEIAAEQLGRGGLVTIPQEAWEALDPTNRAEVADIAAKVGVLILTAEASDDPTITPRVFAPAKETAKETANGTANGTANKRE